MNATINTEMLILGRELRGLTQTELSKITTIKQAHISRYEAGLRTVPDKDVTTIAEALNLPTSFFYRFGQRYGVEASELYHRKRQAASIADLKRLDAQINRVRLDVQLLSESVDVDSPYSIPFQEVNDEWDTERIASRVRAAFKLPSGPVKHLIKTLESAGCIIVFYAFNTDKVDALVQWVKPGVPIILVNDALPADRLRFTLAHELGHMVMHRNPEGDDIEAQANDFASAFLMPADDIVSQFQPISLPHLAQLKLYWKVSIQAMIVRSFKLRIITERQYRSLNEQISKLGYRKHEPNQFPSEEPELLKRMLNVFIGDFDYTLAELGQLLHMPIDELQQIYFNIKEDYQIISRSSTKRRII